MSSEASAAAEPSAPGHPTAAEESSRENEMIGSLGEALAGVSLASNSVHGNGFSFHSDRNSGTPFNLGNQGNNSAGWGGFNADSGAQAFNGNSASGEDSASPPKEAPASPSEARNKSYDVFLSQSPSQLLGNDVFKLPNNIAGLEIPQEERSSDPFRQQPIGQGHNAAMNSPGFGERRKNESPSNLTGTTGTASTHSDSPYANADGNRTIQAYHGYDNQDAANKQNPNFTEESRGGGYGMHPTPTGIQGNINPNINPNMNPAMTAPGMNAPGMGFPYNVNNPMNMQGYGGFGGPYDAGNQGTPQKQPVANQPPPQSQQQQQQVLYMAVPTPDGRGQVLQPVQMVQLPGKPFAYVLPGQPGAMPAMQPGMQPTMPGLDPQQPMMVLPNMPIQQAPQGNDVANTVDISGRPGPADRGMVYPGTPTSTQYPDTPPGLRSDDYNTGNPAQADGQPDPLSALYNTPQRPSLDALLGQVRRLSRDQVGCRLVQQALDEEGATAATLILNEGLPFWGEAMVDPFGNYLFQKILEKITAEERIMLVKSVSPRLVNASLNLHGTRSVQKIVELCSMDEGKAEAKDQNATETASDILTRSLVPAAARLCIDSHGNHVIQRILLKLGHKHAQFVFDAVAESVGDVARHRHGCCVIQRCLDSPPSPARSHLVRRIVDKSLELMQDAYGNYVVQYVLDVCSDEDVHAVCESVVGKINLLAIQKFSSNVMEKCLERCTDRVKDQYMRELSNTERVRELMMDPFGNYVVQRALSVATHAQAVRLVEAMRPHLVATQPGTPSGQRNGGVRNTAGGRRIMAKICRRFPNFTLDAGGTNDEIYSQSKGPRRHHHHHQGMAPPYAQLPHQGQHHMHHQPYTVNPLPVNLPAHQYDQRQPYYDIGDTGYYQHAPHMGNGAYPSGF